ncbi:uncharacterized protein LOC101203482 [Cucumis sativus]|uniref:DC1 domain-containing protein n=1 Tax=Cucumis sativus TaxID=3659 RepID=A0A0A0KXA5_CUCSA|nr:uncharacterized protein LOC101203482 [Cucumis sativus]KGN54285.1 hypothetical protein Csa_018170 [Cucumis sativus]
MAPILQKNTTTKFHFTHPNHPLIHLSNDQDYFCDGCKTFGSDSRYRCHCCDFDIHELCANCPAKLSSLSFHHHLLALDFQIRTLVDRCCDICHDPVHGLVYRCNDCDFNAHPLCTQLPQELRHVIHDNHPLNLQKLRFGCCVVCRKDCSSLWVYGCKVCGLYIHLDCLSEPNESLFPLSSETTSRGIPFAPPPPSPLPLIPYGFTVAYTVYPSYRLGYHHGYLYNNNYVNKHDEECFYGYAVPQALAPARERKLRKSIFSLVSSGGTGIVSSFIFG